MRLQGSKPGSTRDTATLRAATGGNNGSGEGQQRLIDLLQYHLDLYDQYSAQTQRPYDTLKRFFKIYIRDFDGASDIRVQLMGTKSTDEARAVLATIE